MKIYLCLLAISLPAFGAEPIPAAPEPASLRIDVGQAKLNLLLQTWFLADSTPTAAKNNFRARRAEIKLSGNLNEQTRWTVMIDPAKSLTSGAVVATNDNRVLQDLTLQYQPREGWELSAGQFKIPTVAEGLDSSGDLPFPERSLVARTFGDKRQLGFQSAYKQEKWRVAAMLSNGGKPNTDDTNTAKDIHLRADALPFPGFSFGGWIGANDFSFGENGKWGLNLRWKGDRELARFELVQASDTAAGVKTKSKGYVADVGYAVSASLQPVVRFERYYPNSASGNNSKATTLGINYFLLKNNLKLQAAYSFFNRMKGSNGSYASDLLLGTGRLFVLVFQIGV